MAVLMTAQLPGGTKEMLDGMTSQLEGPMRSAQGFILHANGPAPDGWRVTEIWDSQADFEAWFERYVKPTFPQGAPMPSITFDQLNHIITA
jgi:quinol monooxygenase YgiN